MPCFICVYIYIYIHLVIILFVLKTAETWLITKSCVYTSFIPILITSTFTSLLKTHHGCLGQKLLQGNTNYDKIKLLYAV